MIEYIIFLSSFLFFITFSNWVWINFSKIYVLKKKNFNDENSVFIGFNGLFLITLISFNN